MEEVMLQPASTMEVKSVDVIQAIDKAEIDIQIATAKKYRRDIAAAINTIKTYAELDVETAQECFYNITRGGTTIDGVSVRFAEIVAGAWGNLRVATRITGNDGKTITAQGVAFDLEANVAVSVEVKRKITNKEGRTYSEDMQVVTGNAASAIAFRNAVMRIVPKAITKKVQDEIKQVALGSTKDISTRRAALLDYAKKKFGITEEQILFFCGVKTADEIDNQMLFNARGAINAINEGGSTVEEMFITPMKEAQKAAIAAKTAETNKDKVAQAMVKTVKK